MPEDLGTESKAKQTQTAREKSQRTKMKGEVGCGRILSITAIKIKNHVTVHMAIISRQEGE